MRYLNAKTRSLLMAIASGALLVLSFPFPSFGTLAWFALVPLLVGIERSSAKGAFLLGGLTGVVFFGGLLYWIQLFGWLAWSSLTLVQSLALGLFGLGTWLILRYLKQWTWFWLIPSLWIGLEYLRGSGTWGLAWGFLGASVKNLAVLQLAGLIGELGLSFLIVVFNVALFFLVRRGLAGVSVNKAAVAAGIMVVIYGTGIIVLANSLPKTERLAGVAGSLVTGLRQIGLSDRSSTQQPGTQFKIALAQGNIPQDKKFDLAFEDKIKRTYLGLSDRAIERGVDLVVWPETAVPRPLLDDRVFLERLRRLAWRWKTDLVVGSFNDVGRSTYNSAFSIRPDGMVSIYRKMHLVPFGEFVPFKPLVTRLNSLAEEAGGVSPGRKATVFQTTKGGLAAVICFESSDGFLVRKFVQNGARLMLVITNDAWFGKTAAAEQHFQLIRLRAVENGLYVLQAANTGVSGFADPYGRIVARAKFGEEELLIGSVRLQEKRTIYSRFGYRFVYLGLGSLVLAVLLWPALRRKPGDRWQGKDA